MANVPGLSAVAQRYGIPQPIFEALVRQESGGNPNARSPVGAIGYTQLMPGTASSLGVDPHDPMQNLEGGAKYLSQQYKRFGRWDLALAAYNAGPGAVTKYGGVPPYAETQNYVKRIMAMAGQTGAGGGAGAATAPPSPAPGQTPTPGVPRIPGVPGLPTQLSALLQNAAPSPLAVDLMAPLGGIAARTAQAARAPIPTPKPIAGLPGLPGASPTDLPQPGGGTQPPETPLIPIAGATHGGAVPMVMGGNIRAKYPNLQVQSQVDWHHVNPRLLNVLQKEAEKRGVVIVLNSGYRSNDYSNKVGGFAGDPHTKGIAVDAYINGHPIGEVIGPDEWSKLGVRSGATPGFYKGKTDPEHLDLVGIPIKGGKR